MWHSSCPPFPFLLTADMDTAVPYQRSWEWVQVKSNDHLISSKAEAKSPPFYASVHYVKYAKLMVRVWRMQHVQAYVIEVQALCATASQLQWFLDDYSYSCWDKVKDLDIRQEFKNVEARDHAWGDTRFWTHMSVLRCWSVIYLIQAISLVWSICILIFHLSKTDMFFYCGEFTYFLVWFCKCL